MLLLPFSEVGTSYGCKKRQHSAWSWYDTQLMWHRDKIVFIHFLHLFLIFFFFWSSTILEPEQFHTFVKLRVTRPVTTIRPTYGGECSTCQVSGGWTCSPCLLCHSVLNSKTSFKVFNCSSELQSGDSTLSLQLKQVDAIPANRQTCRWGCWHDTNVLYFTSCLWAFGWLNGEMWWGGCGV